MNPRPFVRVSVGSLGLRIPLASKAAGAGVHAVSSPCLCEIRLPHFPPQTAPVPLFSTLSSDPETPHDVAASFYLDEPALQRLLSPSCRGSTNPFLEIVVVTGRHGRFCGISSEKQLGTFKVPVSAEWGERKTLQIHTEWTSIGKKSKGGRPGAELHARIKVEPDPRFIFQFDGEPALSPQIFQVEGSTRQPIFSCKFSRDRGSRCRVGQPDMPLNGWMGTSNGEKERERKERKGWLVMIHDLSGSSVAAASMVTPFVPSSGSNRVSRSNPGAWLILRPEPGGVDNWQPWGRLEAWREPGSNGGLGCRFQLVADGDGSTGIGSEILVSETIISGQRGGEFTIDMAKFRSTLSSPIDSPHSSGDFVFIGLPSMNGYVMGCTVQSERKGRKKNCKPVVQLAARHIACVEDAAVYMALAAAVNLSVDACLPFSRKLRKELLEATTST